MWPIKDRNFYVVAAQSFQTFYAAMSQNDHFIILPEEERTFILFILLQQYLCGVLWSGTIILIVSCPPTKWQS